MGFVFVVGNLACSDDGRPSGEDRPPGAAYSVRESADYLSVSIDHATLPWTYAYHTFEQDGRLYLVWVNSQSNSLNIYDLQTSEKVETLIFPEEGPNGVKQLNAVYMPNRDSLYVRDYRNAQLYLFSVPDLQRIGTFDFFSGPTDNYIYDFPTCKLERIGDRIYACAKNQANTYADQAVRYARSPVGRWVDLASAASGATPLARYPVAYEAAYVPGEMWSYSRTVGPDGNLIYSFAIDHQLYVENLRDGSVAAYGAKGRHIPAQLPENSARDDIADIRYKVETPVDESIIYDKYRRLYYRIYRRGGEVEDVNNIKGAMRDYRQRPVSMLVLNEHFQVVADVDLDGATYYSPNFLVLPAGFYLSVNNSAGADQVEDELRFRRIVVEPVQVRGYEAASG